MVRYDFWVALVNQSPFIYIIKAKNKEYYEYSWVLILDLCEYEFLDVIGFLMWFFFLNIILEIYVILYIDYRFLYKKVILMNLFEILNIN